MMNIKAYRPLSSHPDDDYLRVILRHNNEDLYTPYCTHLYNSKDEGFYEGHYFKTLDEALEDFKVRR
jgi:hypothetical protein